MTGHVTEAVAAGVRVEDHGGVGNRVAPGAPVSSRLVLTGRRGRCRRTRVSPMEPVQL